MRASRDSRLDGFLDAAGRQRANKYCDPAISDDCRIIFLFPLLGMIFTSARHVRLVIVSHNYRWHAAVCRSFVFVFLRCDLFEQI